MEKIKQMQRENLDRHLDDDLEKYHRPASSRKFNRSGLEYEFSLRKDKAKLDHMRPTSS